MKTDTHVLKPAQIIAAILGATLALTLLLAFSAGVRTQAAPLRYAGTGSDPRIRAITVTASLPISDTHPGEGITKTVYFNNAALGVITLTFEISGTPALTLTAGAAFAEPERTLTSTGPLWEAVVTYSVGTGDGDYPGVVYTASNTNALQTLVPITYGRDVVAPTSTVTAPATWPDLTPIPVIWQAGDGQSGIARTRLFYRRVPTTSTGWQDSGLEQTGISGAFDFTPDDYITYTFAAQTTDNVGNVSVWPVTGTQVIVKQPRCYIYLPLVMRHWAWWYQYDIYEPNDTPAQAWGHLASEQVYEAYIWDTNDQNDYYYFTPSTTSAVQILLSHIPANCDYDLYVYYYDEQYRQVAHSNQSGDIDESVKFTPVAGRKYYIRVYAYSGFSNQQPYHLKVTYQ